MAAGDYHPHTKLNFFDHMKLYSKENSSEIEENRVKWQIESDESAYETNSSPETNKKDSQKDPFTLPSVLSSSSPSRKYVGVAQIVKRNIAMWEDLVSKKESLRSVTRTKKTCFTKTNHGGDPPTTNTNFRHCSENALDYLEPTTTQKTIPKRLKKWKSFDNLKTSKEINSSEVHSKGDSTLINTTKEDCEKEATSVSVCSNISSSEKCFTAIETSESEVEGILSENIKCPEFETWYRIYTSDEEKLSYGATYTVLTSNKNSIHSSCTNLTSSSVAPEDCRQKSSDIPVDSAAVNEELSYQLKELSKDYDSVIAVRNQHVIWNMQDSETFVSEWNDDSSSSKKETPLQSNECGSCSPEANPVPWILCKFCTRAIFPGQAKFESKVDKGTAWHKHCFRCYEPTCSKELRDYDHILYNNQPFCFFHYVERSKAHRCKACNEFIMQEHYTYALDHYWHRHHFICSYCKHPLIDSMFIVLNDITNICLDCHHDVFKKECEFCGKFITLGDWFVHSGDLYWHASDSCMRCNTCGNSLTDRSRFYRKYKHLYCNRYCTQERGPPPSYVMNKD